MIAQNKSVSWEATLSNVHVFRTSRTDASICSSARRAGWRTADSAEVNDELTL